LPLKREDKLTKHMHEIIMEICFESNCVELTSNYKEEMKKINYGQSRWLYDQDRKIGIKYVESVCFSIDELNDKMKLEYECINV